VIEIGLVVSPRFQMMIFAGLSVFEIANVAAGKKLYDIHVVSEGGGPVSNSLGISIDTERFDAPAFDTLIVGGLLEVAPSSAGLIDFVRNALPTCRRVASICTGAFILAEAGVLDGRRATTHWRFARELQLQFPKVKVEEDRIFVIDGAVWTSAGMTSGVDLALGMVEKDFGREMARSVAQNLVVYHRRAGGQSQHSALLEMDAKSDRIQRSLDYAKRNLGTELSVKELAEAARLSPRQFSRVLRAETGRSPAKAIEHLRVEAARLMLEESRHPIDVIAVETGFLDPERLRRAFLRAFGHPPQAIRRSARAGQGDEELSLAGC
jgi:transcriptional regulator GlxA family with amidase domain